MVLKILEKLSFALIGIAQLNFHIKYQLVIELLWELLLFANRL
jgi:hypothetical protein